MQKKIQICIRSKVGGEVNKWEVNLVTNDIHFPCLLLELDWKWSKWDTNWYPYGFPELVRFSH